jgi:hypothetical protein
LGENPLPREKGTTLDAIYGVPSRETGNRQRATFNEAKVLWKRYKVLLWNNSIFLEDAMQGVSKKAVDIGLFEWTRFPGTHYCCNFFPGLKACDV